MFLHKTVHDISYRPDLPFPDTSELAGRYWVFDLSNIGFKKVCLDLLIINFFFYSPVKFGFGVNEICSYIAADFSDRSSLTDESSHCLYDRIGFKEIC